MLWPIDSLARLAAMQAQDVPAVAAIERAAERHLWTESNFSDALRARYRCRVAWSGSELAGYAVALTAGEEVELLNLGVAQGHRRRGMGRSLVCDVLAWSADTGARHVFLEVRRSNTAARRLYEQQGFRTVGRRQAYYRLGPKREDAFIMRMDL